MVQYLIVETSREYLTNVGLALVKIGFVFILALIIESITIQGITLKFLAYMKTYLFIFYLKWIHSTKKEIFSLFLIDEIVAIVEILEDFEYQSQFFIIKTTNEYKAERSISNILYLFSFKDRVVNAISKYFTIDRENDQLAQVSLLLDLVSPFKFILCYLLNVVEYVIEKITFNIFKICKVFLIFFRSF